MRWSRGICVAEICSLIANRTPPPFLLVLEILSALKTVKMFKSRNSEDNLSGVSQVSVKAIMSASISIIESAIVSNFVLIPLEFW